MSALGPYPRSGASGADRILEALRRGSKTAAELSAATGLPAKQASTVARRLINRGQAIRLDQGHNHALYALPGQGPLIPLHFRGSVARKAEDDYIALRKAGVRKLDASIQLGLTGNATEEFEGAYRYQGASGNTPDNSTPKFADHDRHVRDVMGWGGHPALSEREVAPRGHGLWTTCLPVIWPDRRAAA